MKPGDRIVSVLEYGDPCDVGQVVKVESDAAGQVATVEWLNGAAGISQVHSNIWNRFEVLA